jgi:hypothetical protein
MVVQFEVIEVYDIPARGGLLVVGREMGGSARRGMVLRDSATGSTYAVLGVEFPTPRGMREGLVTIVVERTGARPDPKAVLTEQTPAV